MYLLDTNILIYFLNNDIPTSTLPEIESMLKNHFNISILNKIEFLGFRHFSPFERKQALEFINEATLFDLNEEIVEASIELRSNYSIKLIDSIIAATAKVNNFALVTRNMADFKKIGIELINPFKD